MRWTSQVGWYEAVITALMTSALSAGSVIIYNTGVDRNALLTFLGAIVGVAGVVLITAGQDKRARAQDRLEEAQAINRYLEVSSDEISNGSSPLFAPTIYGGAAYAACHSLLIRIELLRSYVRQVADHAKYPDFDERANILRLLEDCQSTDKQLREELNKEDVRTGSADWKKVASCIVSLQNGITCAKIPEWRLGLVKPSKS